MKASDLFIKALENEGVECIFGLPGEENLDLLDSIRKSKIKFILTRIEQAAGFMAATQGRLTGKAGVCLATLGPGATNLATAAAYANLGGMPLVMITGQKPLHDGKQGLFQQVNAVEMMKPLVKHAKQIIVADDIPIAVREAFRIAQEERPGAVYIELPEDVAREETSRELFTPPFSRYPWPHRQAVEKAVGMIRESCCPMLLIGASANRNRTSDALTAFINETSIPFFDTQLGKGVVDERHALYMGTAALSAHDYLHCAINKSDLIISVGHDIVEKPPFIMDHGGIKVIHVHYSPASVDTVYFPQVEVIGDIASSVNQLKETLGSSSQWDFDPFMKIKENAETHIMEKALNGGFPIIPQRLVHDVRSVMPEDGIVALDNGVYKIWFARNYKAYAKNTVLLDNALAAMGAGLPSAIGAKLLNPDKTVMAICGDGGFMMNSQEVETAVRLGLNLVVLILRDNAYGMIKWEQEALGFEPYGLDFGNPDFVKYAESYGAHGHRIERTESLAPQLAEYFKAPGVHLVDVPVDYSENKKVLIEELKARTCDL